VFAERSSGVCVRVHIVLCCVCVCTVMQCVAVCCSMMWCVDLRFNRADFRILKEKEKKKERERERARARERERERARARESVCVFAERILGVCMILGMNKFVYKAVNRILLCVVAVYYSVLQCAAVCCSLVQCVAVWCSVLQCGAA